MSVAISLIVSVLALLATFYQLHLQRVHNQKSVKPFAQIALIDKNNVLSVRLHNNGLGPLIVSRFTFCKNSLTSSNIENCLTIDPKLYEHVSVNDAVQRVILPNSHLVVFETRFDDSEGETKANHARKQLSSIALKVEGRDIYDNKITFERNFSWFNRHSLTVVTKNSTQ